MVSSDTSPSYPRGGDHARMTLRMRVSFGRPACLAALALAATSCTFPVEGQFAGRSLADRADPRRTIVLIYNHGFSRDTAGTHKPRVPPSLQFPGVIFLYEGDSYYDLADWEGFEARGRRAPDLKVERLARGRVLEVCARCGRDSHGAISDASFGAAFFPTHVQPLIERVRERIRARSE